MHKVYHFNAWCSIDLPIETIVEDDGSVYRCGGNYPETMKGERFYRFLDMCFEEATSFSLQKDFWKNKSLRSNEFCMELEAELEPYELRTIQTAKWFANDLTSLPEEYAWVMCQKMYRATEETKNILKKYFCEIFLGHASDETERKEYTLEDLCFFKEDKLFVGSISHEHMLYVYPPSDAFEREMTELGVWEDESKRVKEFTLDSFLTNNGTACGK